MGVVALRGASHVCTNPCRALAACLRPHTGVVMDFSGGIPYTVPIYKMRSMAPMSGCKAPSAPIGASLTAFK